MELQHNWHKNRPRPISLEDNVPVDQGPTDNRPSPMLNYYQPYDETQFYIGLGLAIISSVFIGSSFIIKKKALLRLNRMGALRAGSGGYGYLKEWIWWAGLLSMGIGEAANFAAYAFAPASLVTPLGALSVLVAAVLASHFLDEKLNLLGKLGCFLCVLGSTVIVIHAPKEEEVESISALVEKIQEPGFVAYVVLVASLSLVISLYLGPRYGHLNVTVYIALCSAIGSLTVMGCKGLGLAIKDTLSGKANEMDNWLTWVCLGLVVFCIAIQMNYLNKALDLFNTGIVTPVYYVLFTTLVIVASTILFREWEHLGAFDVLGNLCGFFTVVIAIVLLNAFRDLDVSLADIQGVFKPKRLLLDTKRGFQEAEDRLIKTRNARHYGSPGITHTV